MVPIIRGQEISTDNTCKSEEALKEFFSEGKALTELNEYKTALEFDLLFLDDSNPLKTSKMERLQQINEYIKAVTSMQTNYGDHVNNLMQARSNLYTIQLRPYVQDPASRVVNPVFTINRTNDGEGIPLSPLFNAMHDKYSSVTIATLDPQSQLIEAVLRELGDTPVNFERIQEVLTQQCEALFGLKIDFTKNDKNISINKAYLDVLMGNSEEEPATNKEYIETLISACAPKLTETLPTPPFYTVANNDSAKSEKLSILTQFFLAHVNIHCVAKGISTTNFGAILDASHDLSKELVGIVVSALENSSSVEESLCAFINHHQEDFGLARELTAEEIGSIKQKFDSTYKTVTATKENPHMDDFMIVLEEEGKFKTHQGSICTDFSELILPSMDNTFFQGIRADFHANPNYVIPHKNNHIAAENQTNTELNIEVVINNIKQDEDFERLPAEVQTACLQSPAYHSKFQLRNFLQGVAQGKQNEVEKMFSNEHFKAQEMLTSVGKFTDYSGRTFECTAYEYAYWAMDTHMCRMLESHMDDATKAIMFKRCEEVEQSGLNYEQNGQIIEGSKHFDFTPLKTAYTHFITDYQVPKPTTGIEVHDHNKANWMRIGMEQRNLPAHVAQEYCRKGGSFNENTTFTDTTLPRDLTFYDTIMRNNNVLVPPKNF